MNTYVIQEKLIQCKEELEIAMYRSGEISQEDFNRYNELYNDICKILDKI